MHYRAPIPEKAARHVVVDLLASGQVAGMNAWARSPGRRARGPKRRSGGETAYRAHVLNDHRFPRTSLAMSPWDRGVIHLSTLINKGKSKGLLALRRNESEHSVNEFPPAGGNFST